MVSLGLASFFSVGALLKSSAGSTLSQLLYFPEKQKYTMCNSEDIKQTALLCKTLGFQNLYGKFSILTHLALLCTKEPQLFLKDLAALQAILAKTSDEQANTYEIQSHDVTTHGCHLEVGTLSYEGPGVLVHRAGTIQSLARGHVPCENRIVNIDEVKKPQPLKQIILCEVTSPFP